MISVGLIGTGRIGALLEEDKLRRKPCTHLGSWKALPEVEITAICDTDFELAKKVKNAHGLKCDVLPDPVNMVMGYNFDIVSIATPVKSHSKIVELIAQHRAAKIIFCEKPIAHSIGHAEQMIANCKENNIKLAINHTRRWDPLYQKVAEIISKREFGHPIKAVGYFSGENLNDGVHMADLKNWYELQEFVPINIRNSEADYLIFEIDILFQYGRVKISNNGEMWTQFQSAESSHYEGFRELRSIAPFEIRAYDTSEILSACRQLIKCVNSRSQPFCTGEDGLRALQVALMWGQRNPT